MALDGLIECEHCHSVGCFREKDGNYFCENCGTESQEHGQQMVVDETALGIYDPGTSNLKRRKVSSGKRRTNVLSKKRKRVLKSYRHSFTSVDGFTYILKQWTEDVIALGADESLRSNVAQLWYRYLRKSRLAFVDKTTKRRTVGMRDFQVKLAGRRRLLRTNFKYEGRKPREKKMAVEYSNDDQSIQARRSRARKRKTFIKTVSDNESDGDLGLSEYSGLSDSSIFLDESGSDTFSLSLSTAPPSVATSDSYNDDNTVASTQGSRRWSTNGSDDSFESEEDGNILQRQARIFRKFRKPKKSMTKPWNVTLNSTFAVFVLAVFTTKDNWITLGDLLYWARLDSITWNSSLLCIPRGLKISGFGDYAKFRPGTRAPLVHIIFKRTLFWMGSFLNLKNVNFSPGSHLVNVLARYLRELSLPLQILTLIKNLVPAHLLESFKVPFQELKTPTTKYCFSAIPSTDDFCMGLILFALKFIFVLDDATEYDVSNDQRFNIIDWIKLSRSRLGLAVRHSHDLHDQFKELCPNVKKSPAVALRSIKEESLRRQLICGHVTKVDVELDDTISQVSQGEMEESTAAVLTTQMGKISDKLMSKLQIREIVNHDLNLSFSDCPLDDFTRFHLHLSRDPDFMPSEDRVPEMFLEDLERLLKMYDLTIDYATESERKAAMISRRASENCKFESKFLNVGMPAAPPSNDYHPMKMRCDENCDCPGEETEHNGLTPYWVLRVNLAQGVPALLACKGSVYHDQSHENLMETLLPDNFYFILKYMSCIISAKPMEIFSAMSMIENQTMREKPQLFGEPVQTAVSQDICSDYSSRLIKLPDRLC